MASSGEDVCGGAEGRPRNGAASSRDSPPRRQSLAAVLAAAQDATERKLILAGASLRRIVFLLRTLHFHLSWQWSLKRGGFSRASDDVDDDSDDSDDEKGDDDDDEKGDDDEDDEKGDDDDDDDWEPPFPSDLVEVEGYGEGDVVDNPEMDRNHPASWKRRLLRISFYRKVFGPRTLVPFLMERISPRQLALLAEDGLGLMVRSVRFDSEDSESEDEEDGGGAARPL